MSECIETLEHEKMRAQIAKLMAETDRLNREPLLYPCFLAASYTLAIIGITHLISLIIAAVF